MKVALFTNEYPPHIYGGAGVHVDYLSRFLTKYVDVEVRAFGRQAVSQPNLRVTGFTGWDALEKAKTLPFTKVLNAFAVNLAFNNVGLDAQVTHCHTWYTFFAGFLAKQLYRTPLAVTMHSLEPLRPWKAEQLGPGYSLSSWVERYTVEQAADRVIAVSAEMKADILRYYEVAPEKVTVIHNGVDLEQYRSVPERSFLEEKGIIGPYLLFVGRISRQKGILQLIEAMTMLKDTGLKLVLCASAPDTPELEAEVRRGIAANPDIIWLNEMVPKDQVIQLYSHALIFVCPSLYEPFGIINLEAMACQTPVVASRTGGIKEVVVHGETGLLVEPGEPRELAAAIRSLSADPDLLGKFKTAGRQRVERNFSWDVIARKTVDLYREL
jgi:starch synthase